MYKLNGLMDHTMEPPANMDVHNYTRNSHIKVTEMLVVLLFGGKLQILVSVRVFGMESHYICPFRYRL